MNKQEQNVSAEMMRLITSKWITGPLYVAASLGIADLLADGPLAIAELAQKSGSKAPYLYRDAVGKGERCQTSGKGERCQTSTS